MIRHVVLVRFREGLPQGDIGAIFDGLRSLRDHLPGMTNFTGGANISPEGLARGFTHCFSIDFVDAEVRDAYLALPEHEAVGARLVRAAEGGLAGLIVIDFDLAETRSR